ncbi:hypothetical protein SAPIO_CDS1988 [Scedosporium apiospermum]|uniref:Uncharacterized protein n=1 Tax=Pseudallescheria apiosperma TaxID=563466 RepID=A0A084GE69_PSEDA|nr:uncharacterized protein SAPIO_CDS1988 [Scedosporium apiospermum]KEZ45631.1 hypothetical protein SAPIO_CDS1988 [Scedosporium apiospermum]
MSFQGLDPESLALVIELQLADIQSMAKGKHKAGEMRDDQLAMETYRRELTSMSQCIADRRLCDSMARAVEQDADAIAAHTQIEEQAVNDRMEALRLDPELSKTAAQKHVPSDPLRGMFKNLSVSHDDDANSVSAAPESSSWAAKRGAAMNTKRECVSCGEVVPPLQDIRHRRVAVSSSLL